MNTNEYILIKQVLFLCLKNVFTSYEIQIFQYNFKAQNTRKLEFSRINYLLFSLNHDFNYTIVKIF